MPLDFSRDKTLQVMPYRRFSLQSFAAACTHNRIDGFSGWIHAKKIRFFVWFQHAIKAKANYYVTQINTCEDS